jgi:hypothetical protein
MQSSRWGRMQSQCFPVSRYGSSASNWARHRDICSTSMTGPSFECSGRARFSSNEHIGFKRHQLLGKGHQSADIPIRIAIVDIHVLGFDIPALAQTIDKSSSEGIVRLNSQRKHADTPPCTYRSTGSCARAAIGHATVLPITLMKSRRRMPSPASGPGHIRLSTQAIRA